MKYFGHDRTTKSTTDNDVIGELYVGEWSNTIINPNSSRNTTCILFPDAVGRSNIRTAQDKNTTRLTIEEDTLGG